MQHAGYLFATHEMGDASMHLTWPRRSSIPDPSIYSNEF